MEKIHHANETEEKCPTCKQPFHEFWYNKEETNGFKEGRFGLKNVCVLCNHENKMMLSEVVQ